MKKPMLWLAMIAMILGTVAFPATAGATDQYDEESESSEIEELFPSEEESSEPDEDPASEEQYDDEGLSDFESTIPEETTDEETTGEDPFEDEITSEETPEDETTFEETTEGESTDEETTGEETTGGTTTSGTPQSDDEGSPEEPGTPEAGSPDGGGGVPAPPVTTTAPPEIGQEITVNIIDHDLTMTIVDIYDGGVIYLLPDGERYEILLYDLDYDGWISYYEMYICTAGWFGYRYYDYTPDDMYRFIGNTYNINISNTYQDTGAIRPTPTERVKGMLPETGGPALIGGAVALAVVGAALVGRYSKRS